MFRYLVAFVMLVFLPPAARAEKLTRFSFTEPHMGTTFQITLYAPDAVVAKKAAQAAFARIASLDAIMTDYNQASELMRLCAKAGGDPVVVSPELFFVLRKADEVSRLSDGAFDVTVRPVVRLWRLARRTGLLPDQESLKKALALVGFQNVKLDPKTGSVQLLKPGMQLDLGGIAKGYAADEAQKVLKMHGITRALVAAGGDITVSDPPPDAAGWTIAIYPLEPGDKKPIPEMLLKNAAVSTSGDLQQFVEIDGKRYSHIVDPRTGLGLVGRMSATVVAPTGIQSDSLTKVLAVLGPDRGMKILEGIDGVSGRLVRQTEKGVEETTSKRFPRLLEKRVEPQRHRGTEKTKDK
jgi:FAD:protein FMN transferase